MENKIIKKKKRDLCDFLYKYHRGRDNAIITKELELALELNEKEIRSIVRKLRKEGMPIMSCKKGYFYSKIIMDYNQRQKYLYTFLHKYHKGRKNAIVTGQIEMAVELEENDIRRLISKFRREGVPICSCNEGYYYPESYSEIMEVATKFHKYLSTLITTIMCLLRAKI